jgi:hypothetical protein
LDKINDIRNDCGLEPQVIITDHAANLSLGKYNFDDYVRARWTEGRALI